MTLGERLEEARKRKGISIREAAEATKIRADYLMAMEDGSLNVPLPEIYRRGFLRNYGRFLKLDPDQLMTEYDAHQASRAHHRENHRGGLRETFGRIELPGEDPYAESENTGRPLRQGERTERQRQQDEARAKQAENDDGDLPIPTRYLVIGGSAVAVLVLVGFVWLVFRLVTPDAPAPEAPITTTTNPTTTRTTPYASDSLNIRATGSVTLIVKDQTTNERLYSGTLHAGESTGAIPRRGPIEIRYNDGASVVFEYDGQSFSPQAGGIGLHIVP